MKRALIAGILFSICFGMFAQTQRYEGSVEYKKRRATGKIYITPGANSDIVFNDSTTVRYTAGKLKVLINGVEKFSVGATSTTVAGLTLGSTAVTATGTELNYVHNVTSAIQTQIDTKPNIITNAGDTTGTTPSKAGNIFINTTAGKVYISKSAARGGWLLLN